MQKMVYNGTMFLVQANKNKGTDRVRGQRAAQMLEKLSVAEVRKVVEFHKSIDGYEPTPLVSLSNLAANLGVADIFVKDESYRFGLNAFKALGGSYAIAKYLADRLGKDISELSYPVMISEEVKRELGDITFISATDGNHGRGVAWTANKLGQKCVIHMPKGSAPERLENIRRLGATADITDLNYDDAVRLSNAQAKENGWVLVQDTSWEGYEDIPTAIIQGYTTLLEESFEQLEEQFGGKMPTHVFMQAGVGAFSTAVVGYSVNKLTNPPILVVVEPSNAACIYSTLKHTDGQIYNVDGDLSTIMAGLACGEPVTVGIDVLADNVDFIASVPDYVAAQGMRVLSSPARYVPPGVSQEGAPAEPDARVISGESGAATLGFAYEILTNPELSEYKELLGIDGNSRLFFISTEGDTDRDGYDDIIYNGAYARPAAQPGAPAPAAPEQQQQAQQEVA
jgi:diaminopropionate ammonia-lyase